MKKSVQILKTSAVAWIALVTVFSAMPEMVLCIGSHGHLAVEMAHEDHCGGENHSHEHSHSEQAEDSCGDCFDMSLSFDGGPILANSATRVLLIDSTYQPASHITAVPAQPIYSEAPANPIGVPLLTLVTQQTIVLRT